MNAVKKFEEDGLVFWVKFVCLLMSLICGKNINITVNNVEMHAQVGSNAWELARLTVVYV